MTRARYSVNAGCRIVAMVTVVVVITFPSLTSAPRVSALSANSAGTYVYDAATDGLLTLTEAVETRAPVEDLSGFVAPGPRVRPSAPFVAPSGLVGLGDDALSFATRTEKLDHVFLTRHNLDPLVTQLGSREAVVEQMLIGVSGRTPADGVFELNTDIARQQVVVRGAVVDGVVKLGTAFTP